MEKVVKINEALQTLGEIQIQSKYSPSMAFVIQRLQDVAREILDEQKEPPGAGDFTPIEDD